MFNPSPLRYPGGKSKFYPFVRGILQMNGLLNSTYIEPFAGGAGLALRLLFSGDVRKIVINDLDPHIYAFWHSVLEQNEALCDLVAKTPVTMEQWAIQKNIYNCNDKNNFLKLGFATFFLNRTNVSGVLTAGVIGGKKQAGKYKIDARYNKEQLIQKIKKIVTYKENILLFNDDCIDLFSRSEIRSLKRIFINFDPPYVAKGSQLYKNSFCKKDHEILADMILRCPRKWIVTYDANPLIEKIYSTCRIGFWDVTYATSLKRNIQEYIIFKNGLKIPDNISILDPSYPNKRLEKRKNVEPTYP